MSEHLSAAAPQRKYPAAVAVTKYIVQRDEAEFTRMSRNPRHDYSPRVEQRLKLWCTGNRIVAATDRTLGCWCRYLDDGVHRHRPASTNDERIDIDALDVGSIKRQSRQASECGLEFVHLKPSLTTQLTPESRLYSQPFHHPSGCPRSQGNGFANRLAHGFNQDTTQPQ